MLRLRESSNVVVLGFGGRLPKEGDTRAGGKSEDEFSE